jgi:hypothetical protein
MGYVYFDSFLITHKFGFVIKSSTNIFNLLEFIMSNMNFFDWEHY